MQVSLAQEGRCMVPARVYPLNVRGLSWEPRAVKLGLDGPPTFHILLWLLLLRFTQSKPLQI